MFNNNASFMTINKTSTLMPGEVWRFSVSGDIKTKYVSL